MKILLLCNIIPPDVSKQYGNNVEVCGGWIGSLIEHLKNKALKISVIFPFIKNINKLELNNITYYGFITKYTNPTKYDRTLEILFGNILRNENPDIVHIFGTEYPHTLAMTRAFNRPERTVCHIQGLVSVCGIHYTSGLPHNVCHISTLRDFLRHDNISQQQKKFYKRGEFEIEALRNIGHIMGRTEWDKACASFINPNAEYHYVQEIMRSSFYEGQWKFENCDKYTIFMSQGSYPIKGLHYAIEALVLIKQKFPQVKLFIGGTSLEKPKTLKSKIRESYYSRYINKVICRNNLRNNIVFLGNLSAEKMKEEYLSCNVFISASTIENSPNSVGEALLLGVPVVTSDVGGVSSITKHNETAFLYPSDEPYMLAYYVCKVFEEQGLAVSMGEKASKKAKLDYDCQDIVNKILTVYNTMKNSSL